MPPIVEIVEERNDIVRLSTVHTPLKYCLLLQGNDILVNLSPDDYERVIKVVENAILATDLALYFR